MLKKFLPLALICTVLDEAVTIDALLKAIQQQTKLPKEVIIVDGGSTDGTYQKLQQAQANFPTKLVVLQKQGNRSVGRNMAVKASTQSVIACTDAGCLPKPTWLAELDKTFTENQADVVAGYYEGVATSNFEEAVVRYALVMPKNIDTNTFLPATRSMLFTKKVWEKLNGFNEQLADNEDYAFAHEIRKNNFSIAFARDAVVKWQPRSSLSSFYTMIFRFARGDIQAGLLRPKVLLIFARYMALLILGVVLVAYSVSVAIAGLLGLLVLYAAWSIQKNYEYVPHGWYWLPVLQITADLAVMQGSVSGFLRRFSHT